MSDPLQVPRPQRPVVFTLDAANTTFLVVGATDANAYMDALESQLAAEREKVRELQDKWASALELAEQFQSRRNVWRTRAETAEASLALAQQQVASERERAQIFRKYIHDFVSHETIQQMEEEIANAK